MSLVGLALLEDQHLNEYKQAINNGPVMAIVYHSFQNSYCMHLSLVCFALLVAKNVNEYKLATVKSNHGDCYELFRQ